MIKDLLWIKPLANLARQFSANQGNSTKVDKACFLWISFKGDFMVGCVALLWLQIHYFSKMLMAAKGTQTVDQLWIKDEEVGARLWKGRVE